MADTPHGEITLQTLAMPADTNPNGDVFGGWILSQMDIAAGIIAKQTSKSRVATVALNSMVFLLPVQVGDLVTCYAELIKIGNTSMTIKIEAWKTDKVSGERAKVTEGTFIYVAIDEHGKPHSVKK